jgi:murein hydrolase activator
VGRIRKPTDPRPPGPAPGPWVLALALLAAAASFGQGSGVATPSAAGKIKKSKKELMAVQKKLQHEKELQTRAQMKERDVLSRLQRTDQMLGKLEREKNLNEQTLEETRLHLSGLQEQIRQNREQLAFGRQLLKERLRALYRMSYRQPFLGGLLDSENFGDLARRLKFEFLLAQSNEKILNQTLLSQERLEQESAQWNNEEHRRKRILGVLGAQEENVSAERRNRTLFLASVRQEEKLHRAAISELNESAQELQSKVALLLERAQRSERAADEAYGGTGLKVSRGRIPWPVSGEIISFFGRQEDKTFNEVVDNSGIQIKAPEGTPIHSVAAGKVRYADWFKGYGKLVILDHGKGYYSLYAQASELDVSEGQTVAAGQVIGLVGDTGSLVGNSLYFEIRKNGVPQDPQLWLQHRM